jgi:hypothetical protein
MGLHSLFDGNPTSTAMFPNLLIPVAQPVTVLKLEAQQVAKIVNITTGQTGWGSRGPPFPQIF